MSNYEISKSSLLSLKAEILRKQNDLGKAKLENVEKIKTIRKKTPLELKNKGIDERSRNDLDEEDQDLLKLSKSKLEAKAKLYDKLSGNTHDANKGYLVRFDKKNKVEVEPPSDFELGPDLPIETSDEERHFSDEYDEAVDPSEEWVEYTDCLGRSRRCLRKDLEYLKSKDAKLMPEKVPVVEKPLNNSQEINEANNEKDKKATIGNLDAQSQISTEESELISGDMRREMLRQQWENEEEELKNKTDIHYQNVLFSEARQHGVGYYGFSKDEEERAQQQEALKKLREETEKQQKKAQDLKALREKQMAARMKAARNRRRARLGLPPEEDDPTPPSESKPESEEDKKNREKQKIAEETEKLLIEARKRHVRPWDIGKEGVSEHYEMTQEEWNEKQRKERTEEFAPPKSYSTREFTSMQALDSNFEDNDKSLKFSTKKNRKNKNVRNKSTSFGENENYKPPILRTSDRSEELSNNYVNNSDDDSSDRLLQDYKKSQDLSTSPSTASLKGLNPYKNNYYNPIEPTSDNDDNENILPDYKTVKSNVVAMKPTPIINELEDGFDDRLLADYSRVMQDMPAKEEDNLSDDANDSRKRGVEVAPPPTFEYYGPEGGKRPKTSQGQANIADSIEAGLKFLRKQAGRKGRHCVDDKNM